MVTLRCTQKLLRRVPGPLPDTPAQPTTVLGDWYANLLFRKPQQLILCVSERTLLPAKEIHTLSARLVVAVSEVLVALGVAPSLVDRECLEMQQFHFGRTDSKRILGSLNDLMRGLFYALDRRPEESLLQHSLGLAECPCGPLGYNSPDRATLELFSSGSLGRPAIQ